MLIIETIDHMHSHEVEIMSNKKIILGVAQYCTILHLFINDSLVRF